MFPEGHPVPAAKPKVEEEEEEADPPRNFTTHQLRNFDGTKDKDGIDKPVYLSVKGIVFEMSEGRNFYGPEGPYAKFAGRECGMALAKMSFDEEHLDNLAGCQDLNFGERTELDNWIEKFQFYRCYPIKGKLVPDASLPDPNRELTAADLAPYTGELAEADLPEGYAAAPIYVGARDKVYDVSFGGTTFYGVGGPYHKFAGRDASRSLAKMSLDIADLENPDISALTEKEDKVLNDWIKTFAERKTYPVVGKLKRT
jgi:membrane-associated progesterone receptor component